MMFTAVDEAGRIIMPEELMAKYGMRAGTRVLLTDMGAGLVLMRIEAKEGEYMDGWTDGTGKEDLQGELMAA